MEKKIINKIFAFFRENAALPIIPVFSKFPRPPSASVCKVFLRLPDFSIMTTCLYLLLSTFLSNGKRVF